MLSLSEKRAILNEPKLRLKGGDKWGDKDEGL